MAYIREKRDKNGNVIGYKFSVFLGRDNDGKKIMVYSSIPRPEGFTPTKEKNEVKRLAMEWEKEQKDLYERDKNKSEEEKRSTKDKITVENYIDNHWIKKHVQDGNHTPDTVAFYKFMGADIKKYFSGKRLVDIDVEAVLDYLSYLRNEAKTKDGKPYSATTVQHHFSTLRNILEYAVYTDYIKEDPCQKLKRNDRPRREEHEIDFLEEEDAINFMVCLDSDEEKAYWEKIHGSHLKWKALINILIVTGLRRGEVVGLQWGDLDKKNMLLKIRRNVTVDTSNKNEKDREKKIHVGEVKGKRTRKVPISKNILSLLESLKEEQKEKMGAEVLPNAYIFCRVDNAYIPMYPTEPTRLVSKFIRRHKLPNVSPHDLRHTAASLAIQSGANVKEIQKLLGHRDAATTLKFYAGISEKAERQTIDGIESILTPKKEKKGSG